MMKGFLLYFAVIFTISTLKITTAFNLFSLNSESNEPCCKSCPDPTQKKFYSIDLQHGHCGEICMDPKSFWIFKIFEWNLADANGIDNICEVNGYSIYSETVTHGVGPIKATLDLYNPDTPTSSPDNSGKCATPPVADNFVSNSQYEGVWYEIGKIQTAGGAFFERNCVCTEVNYTQLDSTTGDGKVLNSCR